MAPVRIYMVTPTYQWSIAPSPSLSRCTTTATAWNFSFLPLLFPFLTGLRSQIDHCCHPLPDWLCHGWLEQVLCQPPVPEPAGMAAARVLGLDGPLPSHSSSVLLPSLSIWSWRPERLDFQQALSPKRHLKKTCVRRIISQVHAIREGFWLKPNKLAEPNKNMELRIAQKICIHVEEKNDKVQFLNMLSMKLRRESFYFVIITRLWIYSLQRIASYGWKYCWLICSERKILFVGWKVRLISQANMAYICGSSML